MEEAGDELLFCERAAGIDIGKQVVSEQHPDADPETGELITRTAS